MTELDWSLGNKKKTERIPNKKLVPRVGLEPTTN
ncbi:uncharacterized protein METZ01_LOCUS222424 [marine metagenome]|uniref:Uncharacterized protein n=1 Tax=marine metagenome TaxID=408172 RepID=A0A382G2U8_9ZZZZ